MCETCRTGSSPTAPGESQPEDLPPALSLTPEAPEASAPRPAPPKVQRFPSTALQVPQVAPPGSGDRPGAVVVHAEMPQQAGSSIPISIEAAKVTVDFA